MSRHPALAQLAPLLTNVREFEEFEQRMLKLPTAAQRGQVFEAFAQAYMACCYPGIADTSCLPLPSAYAKALGIDARADKGIDGVAKKHDGGFVAWQAKWRGSSDSLSWRELSTFVGLSEKAAERVVVTTTRTLAVTAQERSRMVFVGHDALSSLEAEDFAMLRSWLGTALGSPASKSSSACRRGKAASASSKSKAGSKRLNPLPHQLRALAAIAKAWQTADRTTALMACGSGKTLVGYWSGQSAPTCLVLVPSLSLLQQTVHRYLHAANSEGQLLRTLIICSDPGTAELEEDAPLAVAELGLPVTTNESEICHWLQGCDAAVGTRSVVFATYQSVPALVRGLPQDFFFEFGVLDEAHRTATRNAGLFSLALSDENVPIRRRLFMTATARHWLEGDNEDEDLRFSMDNPLVYGRVAFNYPLSQAVDDGVVVGLHVHVSVITDVEVAQALRTKALVDTKSNVFAVQEAAQHLALARLMEQTGARHALTFHSRLGDARRFAHPTHAELYGELAPDLLHVSGSQGSSHRLHTLEQFAKAPCAVVTNAKALTEGVDVPNIDIVAFCSPKRSEVDVVQAAGRASRIAPGKTIGHVLLTVFVNTQGHKNLEEAVARSAYGEIWNVLAAMGSQDEGFAQQLRQAQACARKGDAQGVRRALGSRVRVDVPANLDVGLLRDALESRVLLRNFDVWDECYQTFSRCHALTGTLDLSQLLGPGRVSPTRLVELDTWLQWQLSRWSKGQLEPRRCELLAELGLRPDLSGRACDDAEALAALQGFVTYHRHAHPGLAHRDYKFPRGLEDWWKSVRAQHQRGELTPEQVKLLTARGMAFDLPAETQRVKHLVGWGNLSGELTVSHNMTNAAECARQLDTQARRQPWLVSEDLVRSMRQLFRKPDELWAPLESELLDLEEAVLELGHRDLTQAPELVARLNLGWAVDFAKAKSTTLHPTSRPRLEARGLLWGISGQQWEAARLDTLAQTQQAASLAQWPYSPDFCTPRAGGLPSHAAWLTAAARTLVDVWEREREVADGVWLAKDAQHWCAVFRAIELAAKAPTPEGLRLRHSYKRSEDLAVLGRARRHLADLQARQPHLRLTELDCESIAQWQDLNDSRLFQYACRDEKLEPLRDKVNQTLDKVHDADCSEQTQKTLQASLQAAGIPVGADEVEWEACRVWVLQYLRATRKTAWFAEDRLPANVRLVGAPQVEAKQPLTWLVKLVANDKVSAPPGLHRWVKNHRELLIEGANALRRRYKSDQSSVAVADNVIAFPTRALKPRDLVAANPALGPAPTQGSSNYFASRPWYTRGR